ncbi:hypothetical protein ACOJVP_09395 [Mycobacterium sp. THU-M116]
MLAEFLGTAALLIAVVGSGSTTAQLSPTNTGVALLANAIATASALYVLLTVFGPRSGAHRATQRTRPRRRPIQLRGRPEPDHGVVEGRAGTERGLESTPVRSPCEP